MALTTQRNATDARARRTHLDGATVKHSRPELLVAMKGLEK